MISVKVTGNTRQVLAEIPKHVELHRGGIVQAYHEQGQNLVKAVRKLIRKRNKTGRLYKFRGKVHQASAPGEAPANRSGRLLKSSDYKVTNWYKMEFGEEAFYAKFLEEGTRKRMAPRPHLRVVVNQESTNFVNLLETYAKKAIGA